MTPEDYLESKTKEWPNGIKYIEEEDAYDAVDMAKRDIAWAVHVKIAHGADIHEIDKYITDICDF